MPGPVKRATRVAGRLREELAAALRGLSDPRVQHVLVSRIEVTDDLQTARVYVRRELGADDEAAREALLKGLHAAGRRLRHEVARALALRYSPMLRFFYDDAPDAMNRVEDILREIKSEGGPKDE